MNFKSQNRLNLAAGRGGVMAPVFQWLNFSLTHTEYGDWVARVFHIVT